MQHMRIHSAPAASPLQALIRTCPVLCLLFRYGPNALTPPKKPGFFAKLWAQLNNVLIFILLAAAVVVAGLQECEYCIAAAFA